MHIDNLQKMNLATLTEVFNDAFSDYIIPVNVTPQQVEARMRGAGVDYALSFGCFEKDRLVGFMYHGIDERNGKKTAFNVGTGVVPKHRGKRLVQAMYHFAFPLLKQAGVERCGLEVIRSNEKAIRAYKSVGFGITRELECFSGEIQVGSAPEQLVVEIQPVEQLAQLDLSPFQNYPPSWENRTIAVLRNANLFRLLLLRESDEVRGYAVIKPQPGQVAQFGVHKQYRGKGFGRALFREIASISPKVSILNVDRQAKDTLRFLERAGLKNFIGQYEMETSETC
ncbi:MAG TPA: GNAT family N-acetyltransferase [Thermotogota bacterium]|nr:GNAT family N-acetyltransferase [Thermotogota bacterium]HRW93868.1 GNAT family N-acetyltransferase [Thermotogota bacterium]